MIQSPVYTKRNNKQISTTHLEDNELLRQNQLSSKRSVPKTIPELAETARYIVTSCADLIVNLKREFNCVYIVMENMASKKFNAKL